MKRRLIFYAPFGYKIPEQRLGGAESGCRRTLKIYQESGLTVCCIDKPAISRGRMVYAVGMLMVPIHLLWLMLLYREAPVHIVGFYCKIARYELILIRLAHLLHHKVVYEMRNGNVAQSYYDGTDGYKATLGKLCTEPEIVFGQGEEVVNFVERTFGRRINCYPNFIADDYITGVVPAKGKQMQLIFFGRIAPPKNIHIMIDVVERLVACGMDVQLKLIGSYKEDYFSYLQQKLEAEGLQDRVKFYGRQSLDFIVGELRQSHYFLFPTVNKGEGHSNSLTEAMACGVVPIVSNVGFNASVCGCKELVVENIDAEDFANRILNIEKSGLWADYAKRMIERVRENYTESIVGKMLMEKVNEIM